MKDHFRDKIIIHKEEQKVEAPKKEIAPRDSPSKLGKDQPKKGL